MISTHTWDQISPAEINRVLDPALRHAPDGGTVPKHDPKRIPKEKKKRKQPKEQLDRLVSILDDMDLPDITPTKVDLDDLELLNNLIQAQNELERLKDIEAEIVNTSKWNHDASEALLSLSSKAKRIPYGTRSELFDLRPTGRPDRKELGTGQASTSKTSTKGKEREANPGPPAKRSIYNLLPVDAEDTWLRSPGMLGSTCIMGQDSITLYILLRPTYED